MQWCVYVGDIRFPGDRNAVEKAIRPSVVGRKNWLFSGNETGAAASPAKSSVLQTARAKGLDSYWHFEYLLKKTPAFSESFGPGGTAPTADSSYNYYRISEGAQLVQRGGFGAYLPIGLLHLCLDHNTFACTQQCAHSLRPFASITICIHGQVRCIWLIIGDCYKTSLFVSYRSPGLSHRNGPLCPYFTVRRSQNSTLDCTIHQCVANSYKESVAVGDARYSRRLQNGGPDLCPAATVV